MPSVCSSLHGNEAAFLCLHDILNTKAALLSEVYPCNVTLKTQHVSQSTITSQYCYGFEWLGNNNVEHMHVDSCASSVLHP